MKCRHCSSELNLSLVDLGSAPPSNAYLTKENLHAPELWFPLRVLVCETCWLAQTEDFTNAETLFDSNYAYFSSFSTSWLAHSERYVEGMIARFDLGAGSHVVEVAANDGYLLQYFKDRNIQCTGVEPTACTANAARAKGINIVQDFFGIRLAKDLVGQKRLADLAVANNVLAHVPDINDFVGGFFTLLKPEGVATFEFPHLLRLIDEGQFDTIYHEHFSYLSLSAVDRIFSANGLYVFDVEEYPTHGGSLRVFAERGDSRPHSRTTRVNDLLAREERVGMFNADYYAGFQAKAENIKNEFISFLLEAKRRGEKVAAYGAAAKGNTLINFSGIRPDLLSFVADRNPAKQGKFMPGSRIPIVSEELIHDIRPDFVVVLPWNLRDEVTKQLKYIGEWGGSLVTVVPSLLITPV